MGYECSIPAPAWGVLASVVGAGTSPGTPGSTPSAQAGCDLASSTLCLSFPVCTHGRDMPLGGGELLHGWGCEDGLGAAPHPPCPCGPSWCPGGCSYPSPCPSLCPTIPCCLLLL